MDTESKLSIEDDRLLRQELVAMCDRAQQNILVIWSVTLARDALAGAEEADCALAEQGFAIAELWAQGGAVRAHDIRQAGFAIHRRAKAFSDKTPACAAFRAAGQATATAHMQAHALVASDYLIKRTNLLYPGDGEAVSRQRRQQIELLRRLLGEEEPMERNGN